MKTTGQYSVSGYKQRQPLGAPHEAIGTASPLSSPLLQELLEAFIAKLRFQLKLCLLLPSLLPLYLIENAVQTSQLFCPQLLGGKVALAVREGQIQIKPLTPRL